MVEIHAYSKAASGGKQLSAHFKVREFACGDGSDAVLVAPRLVMVLETIRAHFGAPVVIHSGYRTPQYNEKVAWASTRVLPTWTSERPGRTGGAERRHR